MDDPPAAKGSDASNGGRRKKKKKKKPLIGLPLTGRSAATHRGLARARAQLAASQNSAR